MFAVIEDRICRVVRSEDHGPDLVKIDVVTGIRTQRSTAGKRPGPGWRPDPSGAKRKWVKYSDVVESGRIVTRDSLHRDYPVGFEEFGLDADDLDRILTPIMQRAMTALGVRSRRVRPEVRIESIDAHVKRDGVPMPTEQEFEDSLQRVWQSLVPQSKHRTSSARQADGRMIIPPKHTSPRPPEPKSDGPSAPDGYVLEDGHRWSPILKTGVPNDKKGDAMELAAENGWPAEMMAGAETNRRGDYGFTLTYMGKKEYDASKHGAPKAEEPEPIKPEPVKLPEVPKADVEPIPPAIRTAKPSIGPQTSEDSEE